MIQKLPSLEDVFIAVMASFIGFGLVVGVSQAAVGSSSADFLTANSVSAQTDGPSAGVTACPAGYVLHLSPNYAPGTGFCVKLKTAIEKLTGANTGNSSTTPAVEKKLLDGQCMATAVTKRDSAIIAALDAHHTSADAALNKRLSDLPAAWQISTRAERKTAIRKAWLAFQTSVRAATRTLSVAKKSAWQQFNIDRKSCGTYGTSDDLTSRGVDNSL